MKNRYTLGFGLALITALAACSAEPTSPAPAAPQYNETTPVTGDTTSRGGGFGTGSNKDGGSTSTSGG